MHYFYNDIIGADKSRRPAEARRRRTDRV